MDTKFPWWPIDYLFRVRYSGKLSMIKGKMEEEGGEKREGRWKLSVKSGIASDRMVDGDGQGCPFLLTICVLQTAIFQVSFPPLLLYPFLSKILESWGLC